MKIAGLPEELGLYLDLCLESAERVPERSWTSHPFLTSTHTTEHYALRTAGR